MQLMWWWGKVSGNDYLVLARFLFPLSFTVIAVDVGEQVLVAMAMADTLLSSPTPLLANSLATVHDITVLRLQLQ